MRKYLLLLFIVIVTMFTFNGCSNSDNDFSTEKMFVGAWKSSLDSKFKSICIMPDGKLKYGYCTKEELKNWTYNEKSGLYYDKGYMGTVIYDPSSNGYWAYNTSTQTISLYSDDNKYVYTYKVTMAEDCKSWVGVDADGKSVSFIKVEE